MLISYNTIGRNIRAARQRAGLTQEALAEKLRISHLHFGRLERGERPISLELLARMAQALDVNIGSLLIGCVVGGGSAELMDDDTRSFAESVADLSAGCTPRTRRLMLSVCRLIAESDKLGPERV